MSKDHRTMGGGISLNPFSTGGVKSVRNEVDKQLEDAEHNEQYKHSKLIIMCFSFLPSVCLSLSLHAHTSLLI